MTPGWKALQTDVEADDLAKLGIPITPQAPFMTVAVKPEPFNLNTAEPLNAYSRVLLIGDSGTGKTHFLGTMPTPFVADFDKGLNTLRGKDVKALLFDVSASGWSNLKEEVDLWQKGARYGCLTFALDSLTMAADAALEWTMNKNRRQTPTIQDWGEAIREVKALMAKLTTLPCHVAVTAHAQVIKDELTGEVQIVPLIFGKDLPGRLGIWFDEVYSTTVTEQITGGVKKTDYRLQVKPDARFKMVKSRMNIDGQYFDLYEKPDFQHLRSKTPAK